jgi:excisionase family DNA binding protein
MNIEFENINLIKQLVDDMQLLKQSLINQNNKRWMSVKELCSYLTFGKDKIYKMVNVQFIEGIHYFKKENRLLFDKEKIDEWVLNESSNKLDIQETKTIIDDILSSL